MPFDIDMWVCFYENDLWTVILYSVTGRGTSCAIIDLVLGYCFCTCGTKIRLIIVS